MRTPAQSTTSYGTEQSIVKTAIYNLLAALIFIYIAWGCANFNPFN